MRRSIKRNALTAGLIAALLFSVTALAKDKDAKETEVDGGTAADDDAVAFLHQPLGEAKPGSRVIIRGKTTRPWAVDRMVLAYRGGGVEEWREVKFKRSVRRGAVATIPEEAVEAPGVDYYIFLAPREEDGEPRDLFASKDDPYRILVHGYSSRSRYESRKAEWNGRLSRAEINYGYSDFGVNQIDTGSLVNEHEKTDRGNHYHEISIAYTYRFLTYLYALKVEIGGLAEDFADLKTPFTSEKNEAGSGMFHISPSVEFEFAKYFGMSVLVRLGASEEEFEGGAGGSIRIGRINGTRMDLGFEGVSHAGWRVLFRFEWDTVPYLPMSFNMERTQWYAAPTYSAEDWGNRMYFEARAILPAGFGLRGHIGFAARDEVIEGGVVAGGGMWIDF